MRPLIVGAGPAGCAAALALSARGVSADLIERSTATGDAICGGFMSWRTRRSLDRIGIATAGHPIHRVVVFAGDARAEASLPGAATGLSRHALDTLMLAAAIARGTHVRRGVEARSVEAGQLRLSDGSQAAPDALFLAVGKHDLRGLSRPRDAPDPTLGLRIRLAAHPALTRLIGDAIELHLFDRGYVGLSLQEDGSANLCLAVRKSRLAEAGGRPETLLAEIGANLPLGERLAFAPSPGTGHVDAIASVPYGWRTSDTTPGLFRLGDQAACIPSLAGEGIGIAIASGMAAADAYASGGAAASVNYQAVFARRTRRPVVSARFLWTQGEKPGVAAVAVPILARFPALAHFAARMTRIGD